MFRRLIGLFQSTSKTLSLALTPLWHILNKYTYVFPAPGEPVTGRTTAVKHDIITNCARPVRCGPRRLAPAGLRTEQTCIKKMLDGGQIEPSDSPWASPVVLMMKKDGSTRSVLTTVDIGR